jgi:16S rRNA (uracil1498-N3)-methyltransferase
MSSHRFYLPPEHCRAADLVLSGGEAHHALHVLRIPLGQRITVLDGAGQEILCEVQHTTRDQVRLKVIEKKLVPPLPCQITLLQALPKGKMIESIIQKATELGVSRIVPLLSERVVTQLDPAEARHKAEKWQGVAIEAIKQCGSPWLPRVETPLTPAQFLARAEKFDLALLGSLQGDAAHPRKFFQAFQSEHGHKPASVAVWVGPEGDFTLSELQGIQSAGAKPITLGPLVLRSETAAIFCLSVINYELASPG